MARIAIMLAVAAFCLYTTPPPNPRVLAALDALSSRHSHQVRGDTDGSFYCPMEPDIRSNQAGKCPRCGMTLVEGVPDILEYPVDLSLDPAVPHPNELTRLTFGLIDPRTERPVRTLEVVHEKLYHVFVVSQDLSFFLHTHPERQRDEAFHLDVRLPKPGLYRVLSDFYPSGATPQLITNTLIVPGAEMAMDSAHIQADLSPKTTENARVDLTLSPSHVVAGQDVSMVFRVRPEQGVEPYLGAWGHMLAASADLVDMTHNHPIAAADSSGGAGKDIQFNMAFPRAGMYRVWVQFQRLGIVNTVAFDVPVEEALR
jgi:heavy metal-binding protein